MFKGRKKRRGFTLAEVLIVVAIVAILLAVAIPNVIGYYRSLKLTELDDSARTIFVAAQNRLTAMRNMGADLSALGSDTKSATLTTGGTVEVRTVAEDSADDLASLVPGGSVDSKLHDNHYVVEIDPKTGAVIAVWYWEKESFDYATQAYSTVDPDKTKRLEKAQMVGYYGGTKVDRLEFGQMPFPAVNVVNAEELRVEVTVPTTTVSAGSTALADDNILVDVTIEGSGGSKHSVFGTDGAKLYSGKTGTVVLDSLKLGYDRPESVKNMSGGWTTGTDNGYFKEWGVDTGGGGEISVKVTLRDKDNIFLPQTVTVHTNAWFADAHEDAGTYSVDIAYGRHLQNLDTATSGVVGSITGAVQVRDIDFDDDTTVTGVYSWQDTYSGGPFEPINNSNLASYDGDKHTISEVIIGKAGGNDVGLFGETDATLSHIRLVNATITGNDNLGTLAGQYSGSKIDDCGAYASDDTEYASRAVTGSGENVGGLVGTINAETTLNGCFAAVRVSGEKNVGGLVGLMTNTSTFTNCYSGGHTESGSYTAATVNVTGSENVGGLVGLVDGGATLTLEGVNYSTCSVKTNDDTYLSDFGLLVGGNATGSTAKGTAATDKAYATGEVFKEDDSKAASADYKPESYLDTDFGTNPMTTGFATHKYDTTLSGDYPYDTNLSEHYGDWIEDSPAAQSFGYYDNCNGVFGFWGYIVDAAGGTPVFANSLAIGTTGPSGTYATDDGYCIPVEHDAAAPADGTSYTVVTPAVATGVTVDTSGKTYDLYKIDTSGFTATTDYYSEITVGATNYYFNPFFACEVQTTTPANMETPQAKRDTNRLDPNNVETANFNGKVIIRTARQLYNMADQTRDQYNKGTNPQKAAQKRDYVQLLNIDYDKYTGTDLKFGKTSTDRQTPASLNADGSYDGKGFFIRNLYIGEGTAKLGTGLFGDTKGTLSNIRLVNVSVKSTANGNKNLTGALAGNIEGDSVSILNCGVYVDNNNKSTSADPTKNAYDLFTIKGEDRSVGGLVGKINASSGDFTVTNCFAAVKVEGDNERVGGLIGHLSADNVDGTLTNCYSGGHTVNGNYDGNDVNVIGLKQVGGLIGCITGHNSNRHTVTLSNVNYSTCSVQLKSTSNSDKEKIGLLVGEVTNAAEVVIDTTSIIYAAGVAYDNSGSVATTLHDESDYLTSYLDATTNLADILAVTNGKTAVSASKYDGNLGSFYPYLSADGMTHYGDWPELQEAVFYWEQEGTETNFYAKGYLNNQEVTLDTLCTEHHDVNASMNANATSNEEWGYGLYGRTSGTVPEKPRDSSGTAIAEKTGTTIGDTFAELLCLDSTSAGAGTGASVTMLSGGTADKACSTASKVGTSQTYHLNLGFGAAIQVGANSTMGTDANPYIIRNVQQLDNISNVSSTYKQTHDLYAGISYTTSYTSASNFVGTYDGQSYRILELSMTNGLFTSINGSASLDSIILYSPSGNATVSGSGATGGLAGSATGYGSAKITNCVVAGYKMNSGNPLGGLLGNVAGGNNLTIEHCEAVNTLGSSIKGGLVGTAGANVTINNSYAGGEITSSGYSGGIVGNLGTSASVSYTNVYSYMSMNSVPGSYLYAIGPAGNTWYGGGHNNCWYWTGGITGNMYNVQDRDDSGVNAAATLDQLKTCISGTGIGTVSDADHTYWPTNSTHTADDIYPYPAVVTDDEGKFVHYGDWE